MSEEKVSVEAEPMEEATAVCQDCGEPVVRCVRHEVMHILKTKGREWLLQQAMNWMVEENQAKGKK